MRWSPCIPLWAVAALQTRKICRFSLSIHEADSVQGCDWIFVLKDEPCSNCSISCNHFEFAPFHLFQSIVPPSDAWCVTRGASVQRSWVDERWFGTVKLPFPNKKCATFSLFSSWSTDRLYRHFNVTVCTDASILGMLGKISPSKKKWLQSIFLFVRYQSPMNPDDLHIASHSQVKVAGRGCWLASDIVTWTSLKERERTRSAHEVWVWEFPKAWGRECASWYRDASSTFFLFLLS